MEPIVIDESITNSDLINNRGQKYPQIVITKDTIVKPSIAIGKYSRDIFLERNDHLWKQLMHHYRYNGFYSMLAYVKQNRDKQHEGSEKWTSFSITCFYWLATFILLLRSFYLNVYYYFYPFQKLSDEQLLSKFSANLDWKDGLIRSFEWHPSSLRCAVALVNDLIYVYCADLQKSLTHICCLKNISQKRVSSMAWHPKRDNILAVACESRILLWILQSDMRNYKPDLLKCLRIIDSKLASPLTSIVFNADGLLIACSSRSSSLSVVTINWNDAQMASSIRIVRTLFSSPLTSLVCSPDNRRLLAHCTTNKIRIYESFQWSSQCWYSNLTSACRASCWSRPTGRVLLFAPDQSSKVFALTFYDKAEPGDVGGGKDNSVPVLDTSEVHFAQCPLGEQIHCLAWDRNSTRLAISFQDKPQVIALFGTRLSSSLDIWPLCPIQSGFNEGPARSLLLKYHDYYHDEGCLLSVVWSNGHVSHIALSAETNPNDKQTIEALNAPRSLTTLCTSFNRIHNGSNHSVVSPNDSLYSPSSKVEKNGHQSTLASPLLITPRRATLFSTRFKLD